MALKLFFALIVLLVLSMIQAQRAPYAGRRPNGYKDRLRPSSRPAAGGASLNEIDTRFGVVSRRPNAGSGGHLPYDAYGDRPLVNRLNRRPVEKQPYWLVNYQAIEAHRNGK